MKRICSYCGRIVDTNNHDCPNKPKDKRRGRQLAKESTRWKKIKAEVKARDLCCLNCLNKGVFSNGQCVHHIIPREINNEGSSVFNAENCIYLCNECHKQVHENRESWKNYVKLFRELIKNRTKS